MQPNLGRNDDSANEVHKILCSNSGISKSSFSCVVSFASFGQSNKSAEIEIKIHGISISKQLDRKQETNAWK